MTERIIIVEVAQGITQVRYDGPSLLYPGDVLHIDLHDYDIEDVEDMDELQEDEYGAYFVGGRQLTLTIHERYD